MATPRFGPTSSQVGVRSYRVWGPGAAATAVVVAMTLQQSARCPPTISFALASAVLQRCLRCSTGAACKRSWKGPACCSWRNGRHSFSWRGARQLRTQLVAAVAVAVVASAAIK